MANASCTTSSCRRRASARFRCSRAVDGLISNNSATSAWAHPCPYTQQHSRSLLRGQPGQRWQQLRREIGGLLRGEHLHVDRQWSRTESANCRLAHSVQVGDRMTNFGHAIPVLPRPAQGVARGLPTIDRPIRRDQSTTKSRLNMLKKPLKVRSTTSLT